MATTKKSDKEKHITVLTETKDKLKVICGLENRTERAVVTMMIDEKYDELTKGKK